MSEEIEFRIPPISPEILFQAAIALYPCFSKEAIDVRGQMALDAAQELWSKSHAYVQRRDFGVWELECERENKLRRRAFKRLDDSVEQDDETTAQGYLKAKFNLSYKTAKYLKRILIKKGIRIRRECLLGEDSAFEVVRTSDLDKLGDMMRTKERERKKASRAKARVSQENRVRDGKKDFGTKPPEST